MSSADAATLVIINGNRRLAAARQFGRSDLLVVTDDSIATRPSSVLRAAHDENTARRDLNPIEEARSVLSIVATYPNAKLAAAAEGWSAPWITHKKALLKIHPALQAEVVIRAQGGDGLTIRLARQLGALPGVEEMSLEQQRDELVRLTNPPTPPVATPPSPAPKDKKEKAPSQPAPQTEWRMPDDAVARFSEAIRSAAQRSGSSPDAVMWEALAKLSV
ncbi:MULTISPECIES: ParB/RepB/Spo0J family partition protein [unclassified Streptomyces]|uniref:ParB/RepB/Spo0J family partition protein n=1 Tax=unclassified Streptomyces TaxID=2593676 RepID=UPI00365AA6A8